MTWADGDGMSLKIPALTSHSTGGKETRQSYASVHRVTWFPSTHTEDTKHTDRHRDAQHT